MKVTALFAWLFLATSLWAQNGGTTTVFMYCYSQQDGGVNQYFSDVFPIALQSRTTGFGPVIESSENKRIASAFSDYLSKMHYSFRPGTCGSRTTEQAINAEKHTRAYGGHPCSNCGKTVETHWKFGD